MEGQTERDKGPGVGALLRASRLRCGEDLRDVAHMLRIRLSHLEAIEEGRFHDLPGPTYAIGFVRAYAEHLGLDSEEVIRRFKMETADIGAARLDFPVPVEERGIPGGAVLFVGVVLAALAYGAWYVSTTKDGYFAELISPLPERLAALMPEHEKPSAVAPTAPEDDTGDKVSAASATAATPAPEAASSSGGTTGSAPPPSADEQGASQSPPMPPADTESTTVGSSPAPSEVTSTGTTAPSTDGLTAQGERGTPSAAVTPSETTAAVTPQTTVAEAPAVTAPAPESEATPPPTPMQEQGEREAAGSVNTAETPTAPPPANATETSEPTVAAEASTPEAVATVPEPLPKPPAPKPPVPTVTEASPPPAPQVAAVPEASPPPAPQVAAVPEAPQTVSTGTARSGRAGEVAGMQDEISRILVRAKANSWIQVRDDKDNQLLTTRMLRAGDVYRVPDRPGLTLMTGNAGALEILVDGQAVPSIGPPGAVRRGVVLDADRLREGTAVVD